MRKVLRKSIGLLGTIMLFPSNAMDIAPYIRGDGINWKDVPAFARLMGAVQDIAWRHGTKLRFGLDWDGDFRTVGFDKDESFLDAPHVELLNG